VCPWVSCRHHLLIEVTQAKGRRPTSLRLNAPGRHLPALRPSSDGARVELWTDEAVELLFRMSHTCSIDAAEEGARGPRRIAALLGVSKQEIDRITDRALPIYKARLVEAGIEEP
jgi:hypothetical protein